MILRYARLHTLSPSTHHRISETVMTDNPASAADTEGLKQLVLQKIYLKDCSFESPNSPEMFGSGQWDPKVQLNITTSTKNVGAELWEIVLHVSIEAKQGDRAAFLCEIQQAGVVATARIRRRRTAPPARRLLPRADLSVRARSRLRPRRQGRLSTVAAAAAELRGALPEAHGRSRSAQPGSAPAGDPLSGRRGAR